MDKNVHDNRPAGNGIPRTSAPGGRVATEAFNTPAQPTSSIPSFIGDAAPQSMRCRVVILEDDPNLAEILVDYLSSLPQFETPRLFSEPTAAARSILKDPPHIALIDLRLNGESGLDCLRMVKRQQLATRMIAFTSSNDESTILEAFRAGADGYLVKQQSMKALAESLLNCAAGRPLVSDAALAAMVRSFHGTDNSSPLSRLTPKERQVLDLTNQGHSCKEIAQQLGVRLNTVYVHNKRILRKLKVGNRYAATFLLRGPATSPSEGANS